MRWIYRASTGSLAFRSTRNLEGFSILANVRQYDAVYKQPLRRVRLSAARLRRWRHKQTNFSGMLDTGVHKLISRILRPPVGLREFQKDNLATVRRVTACLTVSRQ